LLHSCPHGQRFYQFLDSLLPKALLLQLLDLEGGNEGFFAYKGLWTIVSGAEKRPDDSQSDLQAKWDVRADK